MCVVCYVCCVLCLCCVLCVVLCVVSACVCWLVISVLSVCSWFCVFLYFVLPYVWFIVCFRAIVIIIDVDVVYFSSYFAFCIFRFAFSRAWLSRTLSEMILVSPSCLKTTKKRYCFLYFCFCFWFCFCFNVCDVSVICKGFYVVIPLWRYIIFCFVWCGVVFVPYTCVCWPCFVKNIVLSINTTLDTVSDMGISCLLGNSTDFKQEWI